MSIQTKQPIESEILAEELSTEYLVSFFSLYPSEIRIRFHNNISEAEKVTRHLVQGSEIFMRSRKNRMIPILSHSNHSIKKDYFESANHDMFFMNRRVYQCFFDGNAKMEISIRKNVKIWRILKNLNKEKAVFLNNHFYSCNQIRKICSVLYRSLNAECSFAISTQHDKLAIHVEHGVIVLNPIQLAENQEISSFF